MSRPPSPRRGGRDISPIINREAVLLLRSNAVGALLCAPLRGSLLFYSLLLWGGLFAGATVFAAAVHAEEASQLQVEALLALCERGDAQGGAGVDAAFCDWFLLPCDCKLQQAGTSPRWCLPEPEARPQAYAEARERVLAALRRWPEQTLSAEKAVASILQQQYPCGPD
jgi:hypothetical protein